VVAVLAALLGLVVGGLLLARADWEIVPSARYELEIYNDTASAVTVRRVDDGPTEARRIDPERRLSISTKQVEVNPFLGRIETDDVVLGFFGPDGDELGRVSVLVETLTSIKPVRICASDAATPPFVVTPDRALRFFHSEPCPRTR
jgi:hypothetical protein